ncbi:MAG TPA: hypothetical protein VFN43_06470 [Humibacillus sp.]|nr:hypothetical protein [Humibacillus sp.]
MGSGYPNVDIAIAGPPEAYAVRVHATPAGGASAPLVLTSTHRSRRSHRDRTQRTVYPTTILSLDE